MDQLQSYIYIYILLAVLYAITRTSAFLSLIPFFLSSSFIFTLDIFARNGINGIHIGHTVHLFFLSFFLSFFFQESQRNWKYIENENFFCLLSASSSNFKELVTYRHNNNELIYDYNVLYKLINSQNSRCSKDKIIFYSQFCFQYNTYGFRAQNAENNLNGMSSKCCKLTDVATKFPNYIS